MPQVNLEDIARTVLEDRPEAFLQFMARALSIPPDEFPPYRSHLERMYDDLQRTLVELLRQVLQVRQPAMAVLTHPDADHVAIG
jgi:hypothetical protein